MTTVKKIIECVPNFSEGKNQEILRAIADAIRAVAGCTVLDVDPGESTNRTVFTFIGSPERGAHPRMGALDVCPFVPVKNGAMDVAQQCAKEFGSKLLTNSACRRVHSSVAREHILSISCYPRSYPALPVFLYGYSSKQDYRKTMPQIRSGEYEGLKDKPARRKAYGLIDMSKHSGAHPRMGALDVCPFVPVKNATMDDCTQCAKEFGSKLADELDVPGNRNT
ncbi:PREDICTED: formimidoyltransferase-cyclodeaminase-like [Priapulus caudatus]|uniref:Formimidoyltransferase-cyclodeaminase-like n=1 Tax=Priapulus caudatus TaxID=37621 RepID=A0ABM1EJC2_PRICU|nr:PREDICTED: formimidoyltransferase-cyclodeaminase-like [Priapulus caudatus]